MNDSAARREDHARLDASGAHRAARGREEGASMYGVVIHRMVATDLKEARRAGFLVSMIERRDAPSTVQCDWHDDTICAVMEDCGFATTDAAIDEIREGYARALKEALDAEVDNAEGDDAEGDDAEGDDSPA